MTDEALALEFLEGAELLVGRNFGVDAVQLVEIYPVHLEAPEAAVELFTEIFRPAVLDPPIGTGPFQTAFRGDHQTRVGVQCFRNELFRHMRPVRVCRVDEVHSQFDRALKHSDGFVVIPRRTPDSSTGEAHRAEAHAVDDQVFAEGDGSCPGGRHGLGNVGGINSGHEDYSVESLRPAPDTYEEGSSVADGSRVRD